MSKQKIALLGGLCATAAAVIVVGFIFGFDSGAVLIGLGSGIGVYAGGILGNKRAKETDAYREQWLNKRKKRTRQPRETDEAPSGGTPSDGSR